MRQVILAITLAFTVNLHAQLDRVRTDMTEPEFIKAFPEAYRDLDAEAMWIDQPDSVKGMGGNSIWHIYNDTINEYRFSSSAVEGPSEKFPTVDSADVHDMRVALEQIRKEMELSFGKPSMLRSVPLTSKGGPLDVMMVYVAQWNFPDGKMIRLSLSADLSAGNEINAPVSFEPQKSVSYEARINVTKSSAITRMKYGVGSTAAVFFSTHPDLKDQAPFYGSHVYVINDSITSRGAAWEFTFSSAGLQTIYYDAYAGTGYGSRSDADAYAALQKKADILLKQGKTAFGKPDSLDNKMSKAYPSHERNLTYNVAHVYCRWKTKSGDVIISFTERGGGKNPDITFLLSVTFETMK